MLNVVRAIRRGYAFRVVMHFVSLCISCRVTLYKIFKKKFKSYSYLIFYKIIF